MSNFKLSILSAILCLQNIQALSATPSKKVFHFGAGCFWAPADKLRNVPGILSTSVGYCGDDTPFPSAPKYEYVCAGRTKLVEAVRVEYDETQLPYSEMLNLFSDANTAEWGNKRQYAGIIFTSSEEEAKTASDFLAENKQVVATVEPMSDTFYKAEKYHQNYWFKWRIRVPALIATLAAVGHFGGDSRQTIYNAICYAFIIFTLLERKVDTDVEKIIIGEEA